MRVGKLDKRITIKNYSGSSDGQGGLSSVTWSTVAVVWANIRPLSSGEQFYRQGHQSSTSHEITIWYRDDITIGMRIYYNARVFEIRGSPVDVGESREFLSIPVEEVSP